MADSISFLESKIEILERRIDGLSIENQSLKDYIQLLEAEHPRKFSEDPRGYWEDMKNNDTLHDYYYMYRQSFSEIDNFYRSEFKKSFSIEEIQVLRSVFYIIYFNQPNDMSGGHVGNQELSLQAEMSIDSIIKYRKSLTESFPIDAATASAFHSKFKPTQEQIAKLFDESNKVKGILVYEPKGTRAPGHYRFRFSETLPFVNYSFLSIYD